MEDKKIDPAEKLNLNRREFIFKSALSVPFAVIAYRLWDLQVVNGEKYSELSAGNRIRLKPITSPLGIIYDRQMEIMATNVPSYNLLLTKEDSPNPELSIKTLSYKLGLDLEYMMTNYNKRRKTAKFIPFVVAEDISWDQMAYFLTFQSEFPGISVDYISKRFYPNHFNLAHVLGYMGGIDDKTLSKTPDNKRWSAQILGKSGVEKIYNDELIGIDGGLQIEVDNQGRTIRELSNIEPKPGKTIRLTVDHRLQNKIEELFGKRNGSAVVTDVATNEVLAMMSCPAYDPNSFSLGISADQWRDLLVDSSKPLINKSIQGIYSPGSTFKMLIAYAGLDLGLIDKNFTHHCGGYYRNYRQTFNCWKKGGHGRLNVVSAIEQSCNVFFYNLGNEIGIEKIKEYADKFGLGKKTGINLQNENTGIIPSKEWKKRVYNLPWFPGETISVSIGQGYVSVTPIQLLNYMNVFINGGNKMVPKLIKEFVDGDTPREPYPESVNINLNEDHASLIREGMFRVINGKYGTARRAASRIVKISGKTGTTQVIGNKTLEKMIASNKIIDEKYNDHAWFVGFAPYEKPEISVVVMIENGKSGSNASLLAKQIIEYYMTEISPVRTI